jgi:hypothetical protein
MWPGSLDKCRDSLGVGHTGIWNPMGASISEFIHTLLEDHPASCTKGTHSVSFG